MSCTHNTLIITHVDAGDLLLASCSQDTCIRLWRIAPEQGIPEKDKQEELQLTGNTFSVGLDQEEKHFAVTLESILIGMPI